RQSSGSSVVSLGSGVTESLPFIDPQHLKVTSYKRNKSSDVYSFGVILWIISSGQQPFESINGQQLSIFHWFFVKLEEKEKS
ncbi:23154_t:CDS:1, partial [Racocetra persica]